MPPTSLYPSFSVEIAQGSSYFSSPKQVKGTRLPPEANQPQNSYISPSFWMRTDYTLPDHQLSGLSCRCSLASWPLWYPSKEFNRTHTVWLVVYTIEEKWILWRREGHSRDRVAMTLWYSSSLKNRQLFLGWEGKGRFLSRWLMGSFGLIFMEGSDAVALFSIRRLWLYNSPARFR